MRIGGISGRFSSLSVNAIPAFGCVRVVSHGVIWGLLVVCPLRAQTLNDAVNSQLGKVDGLPCLQLLGADQATDVLVGPLASLCSRGGTVGQGAGVTASAGGGGGATPTNLPRVVRQRLSREAESEQHDGGAGDDALVELGQGLSLFFSSEYQSLDRKVTTFEDGYDSNIWHFTGGADYQLPGALTLGGAFDYKHQEGDFAASGGFRQDSYGALVFAGLTPMENAFVQLTAGYAFQQNQRNRFASFSEQDGAIVFNRAGFVASDYDGHEMSAGVLSGYDFNIANVTIGPRLGVDWTKNIYDSYLEAGNTGLELNFAKDRRTSLQSRTGVYGAMTFSTAFAVIVPQVSFDWVHEFSNDQREIGFSFVGDTRSRQFKFNNERPDRDFFEVTAGSNFVLAHGVQAYLNYRAIAGHGYFDGHGANLGLRMEF